MISKRSKLCDTDSSARVTESDAESVTDDDRQPHNTKGYIEMDTETLDIWQFLELPNAHASAAQTLYEWGMNCDRAGNPFMAFLDLIGWSSDHLGQRLAPVDSRYGYKELEYLANALIEYSDAPHDVMAWIDELMNCEGA